MTSARLVLVTLVCVLLGACATTQVEAPQPPNETILANAKSMVAEARAAGAAQFAPQALTTARRRLTVARMILYRHVGDAIDDQEQHRLQRLADAAYLDARLALVRTQAGAVGYQRQQLAGKLTGTESGIAEQGERR